MASTISNITAAFTHAKLDSIEGEPNYESLKKLREQLGENAARILTTYGGGKYGHLGLIIKPNVYLTLAGTAFEILNDPGLYDENINEQALATQRSRMEHEHDKRKAEYDLCIAVNNALKNQIIEAIKGPYLMKLRDQ